MSGLADETVRLARERLYSSVLSDVLDKRGLLHQVLSSQLRPLDESLVLCGRARTADFRDTYHAEDNQDAYGLLVPFEDSLVADDVVVLACGPSQRLHPWGGTQALATTRRGAVGCVTDGLVRDVAQIRELKMPTFALGMGAVSLPGRGRIVAVDVPVHCGGVWISPGDLVFGDADGVLAVPREAEAEVIRAALALAAEEREIVRKLREGATMKDIYRHHRTF